MNKNQSIIIDYNLRDESLEKIISIKKEHFIYSFNIDNFSKNKLLGKIPSNIKEEISNKTQIWEVPLFICALFMSFFIPFCFSEQLLAYLRDVELGEISFRALNMIIVFSIYFSLSFFSIIFLPSTITDFFEEKISVKWLKENKANLKLIISLFNCSKVDDDIFKAINKEYGQEILFFFLEDIGKDNITYQHVYNLINNPKQYDDKKEKYNNLKDFSSYMSTLNK